jgi:DHA1 family multidrug resistance protein-like MFS transporter
MGRLSDRYGRVPMIAAGLALGGVTMAVMIYTGSYAVLMVLIALFGLGLATVTASTAALVADFSRVYSRGSALGVLSTIMDVGHSTGPMLTGLLIGAYSYRLTFGLVGTALVLVSLVFGFTMRRVANGAATS